MDPSENHTNQATPQHNAEEVRRLAAIMFTDIKDFSKKMQDNESSTMQMLATHNSMMREVVNKYNGHVIKTVGDAFLVSFESVLNAVQCAIEAQQQFHQHNSREKDREKITVRIGVHLGDVIIKENDVFGDGVNIASRIQSMAEPGGVNISNSVYDQVKNKLDIHVINLGVPQLKNIKEAIKVYQVIIVPTDKARGKFATRIYVTKTILKRKRTQRILALSTITLGIITGIVIYFLTPPPPPNSLAVLPFRNIGDPTNEYIADGFSEDLITYLSSQLTEAKVLSRGSTFELKGTEESERSIAKKLQVRYLLSGSVQVSDDNLIVNARLTEPAEGSTSWAHKFEKSRKEILSIQHEIYRKIALRFEVKLATEAGLAKTSSEVYNIYLRGLDYDRKERKEDNQLAIASFQEVVDKDPTWVQGYVKLAGCQLLNLEHEWDLNEKWLLLAEQNSQKAYMLDSTMAEVHLLLGKLYIVKGEIKRGMEYLERSIQINPNLMRAYIRLGNEYLQRFNDPGKAILYYTKAYELEPTNLNTSLNLGVAYATTYNYPEAIRWFHSAATINPIDERTWINLGVLYERIAVYDSAELAYKSALERNPRNPMTADFLGSLLIRQNQLDQAEKILSLTMRYLPDNYNLLYRWGILIYYKAQKDSATQIWKLGLRFAEAGAAENPNVAQHRLFMGLFSARLGFSEKAIENGKLAFAKDSSEDITVGMARIYAIVGQKQQMIEWFRKARSMNPEHDEAYLRNEMDFYRFHSDPDLLFVARR